MLKLIAHDSTVLVLLHFLVVSRQMRMPHCSDRWMLLKRWLSVVKKLLLVYSKVTINTPLRSLSWHTLLSTAGIAVPCLNY
jgi:hypothetical protein